MILALAGITFALTEHLRSASVRQNQTRAIYLAQAGVMRSLFGFRENTGVAVGEQTVFAGPAAGSSDDDVYTLQPVGSGSTQADFLLMNMRGAITFPFPQQNFCSAPRDRIEGWPIRNVLAAGGTSLVIQSFKVNWDPPGSEGILRLDLNGTSSDWQAPCGSPAARDTDISLASVPVANRTLGPLQRWGQNRIWFTSTGMDGKNWIDVTFTLTSGSRTSRWDQSVANRTADFTLNAVGEVRRGAFPFVVWRRLRAQYRICGTVSGASCDTEPEERSQPGNLVSYAEQTVLTP